MVKQKEYQVKVTLRFNAPSMYSENDLKMSVCELLNNLTDKEELEVTSMHFDTPKEFTKE